MQIQLLTVITFQGHQHAIVLLEFNISLRQKSEHVLRVVRIFLIASVHVIR